MILFQLVEDRTAEAILKGGFEDLPFQDLIEDGQVVKGVWLDDEPEIREFLVPASLVNSFGPPKIADVDLNWPGLLDDIYTEDIGEDPE